MTALLTTALILPCLTACGGNSNAPSESQDAPENFASEKCDKDQWDAAMDLSDLFQKNISYKIKATQVNGGRENNYDLICKFNIDDTSVSEFIQYTFFYNEDDVAYASPVIDKIYQYRYPVNKPDWQFDFEWTICKYSGEKNEWEKYTQENGFSVFSKGSEILSDIMDEDNYDLFEYDNNIKGYVSTSCYEKLINNSSGKIIIKFNGGKLALFQILPNNSEDYAETILFYDLGTTVVEDIRDQIQ